MQKNQTHTHTYAQTDTQNQPQSCSSTNDCFPTIQAQILLHSAAGISQREGRRRRRSLFFMSLRCRRMKQPAVSLTVTVWLNIKYSTYTVYINIYIHTYDHPHLLTQVLCLWFPVSRCSLLVRLYFLTSSSLHVKTSDGSGSLQTSLQVLILVSVHGLSWETSFHLCWRGFFSFWQFWLRRVQVWRQTIWRINKIKHMKTNFDLLRLFSWDFRVLRSSAHSQKKLMNNYKNHASKITREYLPLTLNTKPQV